MEIDYAESARQWATTLAHVSGGRIGRAEAALAGLLGLLSTAGLDVVKAAQEGAGQ